LAILLMYMSLQKENKNQDMKRAISEDPFEYGEIRTDYRTGFRSVFALSRKDRPIDYLTKEVIEDKGKEHCPFEPEKYDLNKTFFEIGDPWRVRVIYNKYPLFEHRARNLHVARDIFEKSSNYGFSFVIIDSREHSRRFEQFDEGGIKDLAKALAETERRTFLNEDISFVYLNKNFGRKSSGTLSHSHWQTLGFSGIPEIVRMRLGKVREFKDMNGSCLMEHAYAKEKERTIFEDDSVVAFAPFAQLYTGETVVMPKRHVSALSELSDMEIAKLLSVCKNMVIANNAYFGTHAYNMLGYSLRDEGDFHFYIEIVPRMSDIGPTQMAGYFGSSIMPEDYSNGIREIMASGK
jgi:UDPglucose--hexose-1-phosphate uridylyltransferase